MHSFRAKWVTICFLAGVTSVFAQPVPHASLTGTPDDTIRLRWDDAEASIDMVRPKGSIQASLAGELLARWNLGGCGNESCKSNRPGFHPGTRVIVEMPALSGPFTSKSNKSTLERYLAEFRNRGYWAFRGCYETTARETRSRGGDTLVRVQVDARGFIVRTHVLAANVDQRSIADCVANATRSMRLSRVIRGRMTFVLRIRMFPGDAPLALSTSRLVERDVIDPKYFGTEVTTLRKAIEDCVTLGVRRDAKLWGRISMVMKVAQDGRIIDFKEADSHFPDRMVIECSRMAARNTVLPRPQTAGVLQMALRVGELGPMELDTKSTSQSPDSP